MRIDLVSGATYFPAKVTPRQKTGNEPRVAGDTGALESKRATSLPGEKLTSDEILAIQKLFGVFERNDDNNGSGSVCTGQFIDMTI
jgi:hypothetical protein